MMRIGVVGCGAMGSVYAARLSQAGHDVLVVDRGREHVAVMNRHGLEVEGPEGVIRAEVRATTKATETPCDLVILAVKATHVDSAIVQVPPLLDAQTAVVTIQNGLGSADRVIAALGQDRVVIGVASGFGASRRGAGRVHHNAMRTMQMGVYAGGPVHFVDAVVDTWLSAGFDAVATDDILALQWRKLICNCAYSGPSALTGLTVGEILDHPEVGTISRSAAEEAHSVAMALGIETDISDPIELIRDFAAQMPEAKPSTLLDHEARKPSEIRFINGAVPEQAARVGMEAPVNATLTALVLAKERAWST